MKFVNRFVDLASTYPDGRIPLDEVFHDAQLSEQEQIIKAMYVISDRRIASGQPIGIQELSDSIPDLVTDKEIMDAAVEISMQGLVASGLSRTEANESIVASTASLFSTSRSSEAEFEGAPTQREEQRNYSIHIELPTAFGRPDLDGKPRYELRRIIGSGNQGTMYEAVDRVFAEDGQPSHVAVKVYHDAGTIRSAQEGARARRIRHKNVARVIDQGRATGGESYVAYELIEGQSLDVWVKHRRIPLSTQQACRIVIDLARGVQCAHNAGVIHRDIKPSNILVNRDEEPIITDFGIAHSSSTDPQLSHHYGTRGSLAFMAPEQFDGSSDGAMPSVDIYALGGLLYWLLFELYPNGDSVSDAVTYLELRSEGGPKRIQEWSVDWRLQAIVGKALCVDPNGRYQSAEALALDLEDYLAHNPIPWLDRSTRSRVQLFARRNPLVLVLNILVVTAIIASVWSWSASRSAVKIEQTRSEADLQIERLNTQIAFEQDRIEQIKEKSRILRMVFQTWSDVLNESEDEGYTVSNLLFLYTISTNGFLDDDPELAEKILNRRIEVGENFLASIDPQTTPAVHLALWHEMLGEWYKGQDDAKSKAHLEQATRLAEEYAPDDKRWLQRLAEH
jgi:serine/threonine protein kinase